MGERKGRTRGTVSSSSGGRDRQRPLRMVPDGHGVPSPEADGGRGLRLGLMGNCCSPPIRLAEGWLLAWLSRYRRQRERREGAGA